MFDAASSLLSVLPTQTGMAMGPASITTTTTTGTGSTTHPAGPS